MKLIAPLQGVFVILACAIIGASGQLITQPAFATDGIAYSHHSSFASDKSLSGAYFLPTVTKSSANPSERTLFVNQDASSLSAMGTDARDMESVLDVSVLRETSAYRNALKVKMKVSDKQVSGIHAGLERISAAYRKPGTSEKLTGCDSIGMSVKHRISVDPTGALQVIEVEIGANTDCACEIVKAAIIATGANPGLAADIAETAIIAAPEKMRIIAQCAIAASPEALPNIQVVLARLDPVGGNTNYRAKDSKTGTSARGTSGKESIIPQDALPSTTELGPLALPDPVVFPTLPLTPNPPVVTNPDPGS